MTETTFAPDKQAYIQSHITLTAIAMGAGMLILWVIGNPYVWTGAIGGLAAVAVRGWYLFDEEMGNVWTLANGVLSGSAGRRVPLDQIEKLRSIGSAVQIITRQGDKHLIKYQSDPKATINRIEAAR